MDYPEADCSLHPDEMWTWDGYCWICISCIFTRKVDVRDCDVQD